MVEQRSSKPLAWVRFLLSSNITSQLFRKNKPNSQLYYKYKRVKAYKYRSKNRFLSFFRRENLLSDPLNRKNFKKNYGKLYRFKNPYRGSKKFEVLHKNPRFRKWRESLYLRSSKRHLYVKSYSNTSYSKVYSTVPFSFRFDNSGSSVNKQINTSDLNRWESISSINIHIRSFISHYFFHYLFYQSNRIVGSNVWNVIPHYIFETSMHLTNYSVGLYPNLLSFSSKFIISTKAKFNSNNNVLSEFFPNNLRFNHPNNTTGASSNFWPLVNVFSSEFFLSSLVIASPYNHYSIFRSSIRLSYAKQLIPQKLDQRVLNWSNLHKIRYGIYLFRKINEQNLRKKRRVNAFYTFFNFPFLASQSSRFVRRVFLPPFSATPRYSVLSPTTYNSTFANFEYDKTLSYDSGYTEYSSIHSVRSHSWDFGSETSHFFPSNPKSNDFYKPRTSLVDCYPIRSVDSSSDTDFSDDDDPTNIAFLHNRSQAIKLDQSVYLKSQRARYMKLLRKTSKQVLKLRTRSRSTMNSPTTRPITSKRRLFVSLPDEWTPNPKRTKPHPTATIPCPGKNISLVLRKSSSLLLARKKRLTLLKEFSDELKLWRANFSKKAPHYLRLFTGSNFFYRSRRNLIRRFWRQVKKSQRRTILRRNLFEFRNTFVSYKLFKWGNLISFLSKNNLSSSFRFRSKFRKRFKISYFKNHEILRNKFSELLLLDQVPTYRSFLDSLSHYKEDKVPFKITLLSGKPNPILFNNSTSPLLDYPKKNFNINAFSSLPLFYNLSVPNLSFFFKYWVYLKLPRNSMISDSTHFNLLNSILLAKQNVTNSYQSLNPPRSYHLSNLWSILQPDYTIRKKLLRLSSSQSCKIDLSFWYYKTLLQFIENCSGRKVALRFGPFIEGCLTFEDKARCIMWNKRVTGFQRIVGNRIFIYEGLSIVAIAFRLKDPTFLANWIRGMLTRLSFWKYRLLFRYIKFMFKYVFKPNFYLFDFRGVKLQLKGKISVAGNARTRTLVLRVGDTSHSKMTNRVAYDLSYVHTFTGIMGFKLWFFY